MFRGLKIDQRVRVWVKWCKVPGCDFIRAMNRAIIVGWRRSLLFRRSTRCHLPALFLYFENNRANLTLKANFSDELESKCLAFWSSASDVRWARHNWIIECRLQYWGWTSFLWVMNGRWNRSDAFDCAGCNFLIILNEQIALLPYQSIARVSRAVLQW